MSKFNAKNLSYESNEPAFLRKLRGEFGGADAVRHERPVPRPRKMATGGDEDDEPTYVVEESQDTLSKEEYEALMRQEEGEVNIKGKNQVEDASSALKDGSSDEKDAPIETNSGPAQEQVAAIGVNKKKRTIVAVGVEDKDTDQPKKDRKQTKTKKGKKVKLSFDDAS